MSMMRQNRRRGQTIETHSGDEATVEGRPPTGRIFVGGIMQGSIREMAVHDQDYRDVIADIIRRHHPGVAITDPRALHPDSVHYGREEAVHTFLAMLERAADADVLIAYLPEASLGTAIEIWQAYQAGKPVLVISPMTNNWTLWATATHILPDLRAFEVYVAEG
ncbi:MAG: hypothetical protein JSV36_00645, partial [Anaerolineae bacterium]